MNLFERLTLKMLLAILYKLFWPKPDEEIEEEITKLLSDVKSALQGAGKEE